MYNCQRHIFLVPLKTVTGQFLDKIKTLSSNADSRFLFLLSIQDYSSYLQAVKNYLWAKNVRIISPRKFYDRTEHWEYITKYAYANIEYDTFSYYFFGDTLRLKSFPQITDESDIYINDYCIDFWVNVKENVSHKEIEKKTANEIIRNSLLMGRPLFAPLQKIIFKKRIVPQMIFEHKNSYVCDQLIIYYLIASGNKVKFIKSPFYRINSESRLFSATISFFDVIKQQLYLYAKLRCVIGFPMILLRTIFKFLFN
ncbi:TPA: hypothetical protein ACF2XQ_001714 [Escherichia coli]|uniref:hypothetical protein n=1 Tax=Escherichia coli TaxID=562 RepID=UPI00192C69FC|nr:hypothetical protein [Escherichia coli]